MGMFKRGYEAAREEKKRQDENREKMGKGLFRFFLAKDGDEATVRFLTEEPINFYEHTLKRVRNGKEFYDTVVCTQDSDCPYCADGDRPSFKSAYLVWDKREFEAKDSKGKKVKRKGSVKLYVQGTRVTSQLDRLQSRYGLTNREYTISREGSGTSTTYLIDRGDELGKLSKKEIENMLPEKLREEYDGTSDSLYGIVQSQLEMLIEDNGSKERFSDDEDDEDEDDDNDRNLISDDEDEDEDELVRKKSSGKKTLGKKLAPKEHSRKPSVKSMFKNRK